mmetsp:Transcript_52074/g.110750  ORF Transcript_52074/g.110750 Transcript_52074/m.110750 type:complete len:260 (+) Transcript_52074:29-808(+)
MAFAAAASSFVAKDQATAELPPGWNMHWSAQHDRYYYHSPASNESRWDLPEGSLLSAAPPQPQSEPQTHTQGGYPMQQAPQPNATAAVNGSSAPIPGRQATTKAPPPDLPSEISRGALSLPAAAPAPGPAPAPAPAPAPPAAPAAAAVEMKAPPPPLPASVKPLPPTGCVKPPPPQTPIAPRGTSSSMTTTVKAPPSQPPHNVAFAPAPASAAVPAAAPVALAPPAPVLGSAGRMADIKGGGEELGGEACAAWEPPKPR